MDKGGSDVLSDFFDDSADDIFSLLESLDDFQTPNPGGETSRETTPLAAAVVEESHEAEGEPSSLQRICKRQKVMNAPFASAYESSDDGQQQPRSCHIAVERNRRKQMNDHLSVLRTLMPAFYVKRGDQASIIEAVVDYINELQHILQSLEAKKQRKVYSSDNNIPSPRILTSPRKPAMSPRLSLPPISPRTPQPNTTTSSSSYKPTNHNNTSPRLLLPSPSPGFLFPTPVASPPTSSLTRPIDRGNEVAGKSKSDIADVEVKFSGSNVILKTVSPRIPGQALKIISALEDMALEILHVSISTINDATSLYSYTIKVLLNNIPSFIKRLPMKG
ncbi:hypothetical protein DM860_015363 [Cuscuta australis]|uniref:BHLH domain-containing protein n=1 Tax=Cuscuta australis TaxID=267555 RepID=A0A328DM86_9ASTE|nr:hypothetical protein DM860_015363 [Cuscuta australis]